MVFTVLEKVSHSFTVFFILLFCSSGNAQAQRPFQVCSDTTFCMPGINGAPRPKGIIFERQNLSDFSIATYSPGNPAEEKKVSSNERIKVKLRAPIINNPGFKLGAEARYFVERYELEGLGENDNTLLNNLQDKALRSVGLSVFGLKPFLGNKYILSRASISLNGDFDTEEIESKNTIRASYSLLYGIKLSPYRSVAFGVNFSNNFGRFGIIPLLSYNVSFDKRWLFESILPLSIKQNYISADKKNVFSAKVGLSGGNYNLLFSQKNLQEPVLFLRKSEIRSTLSYEREIHDWLWFGIEAGWNKNIELNVSKSVRRNDDLVFESDVKDSFFTAFRVFIVPPKKFLK